MTEIIVAQDTSALVTFDIAKARHEVLIAVPDKKRQRRLTILNQLDDFNRRITALKEYGRPVRIAFEAMAAAHRQPFFSVITIPTRSSMTPMRRYPNRCRFSAILFISIRISGLSGGLSRRTVFGSTPTMTQARR